MKFMATSLRISSPARAISLLRAALIRLRKRQPTSFFLSYVRTYDFPGMISRSSNNYGPFQFPEKLLPLMMLNALDDRPIPIYGDGKQQRDWLHVEDNCRGILAVLERGRLGEMYNIGGLDIVENMTLARRVLQLARKHDSLLSHVQDRPGHDRAIG